MTTIIALVSQKGGVTKSTLSRALACEATKNGLRTKVADLDTQQGTSVDWHRRRLANNIEPTVSVESFATAKQALAIAAGYDLLVLDCPARTSKATLEIARAADLVVQPSGPSTDDLAPAVREYYALEQAGIPKSKLALALSRVGTDAEEIEARAYIEAAGFFTLDGYLPERPAYRKAQNLGFAITETPYSGLNAKADTLIQAMIDRASNG